MFSNKKQCPELLYASNSNYVLQFRFSIPIKRLRPNQQPHMRHHANLKTTLIFNNIYANRTCPLIQ
jgi:hypothetical protein